MSTARVIEPEPHEPQRERMTMELARTREQLELL